VIAADPSISFSKLLLQLFLKDVISFFFFIIIFAHAEGRKVQHIANFRRLQLVLLITNRRFFPWLNEAEGSQSDTQAGR
jgi:hypothetical protein